MPARVVLALVLFLAQASECRSALEGQVVVLGTRAPVARARLLVAKVGGTTADYQTGVADSSRPSTFGLSSRADVYSAHRRF
jgi:hypothetical protein